MSFEATLFDDLGLIGMRAAEIAKERGRAYVSATTVAMALGDLAENLKINAFQIWGPKDDDEGAPAAANGELDDTPS